MAKAPAQFFVNLSNEFNRNDLKRCIQIVEETSKQGLEGVEQLGENIKEETKIDESNIFNPENLKRNVEAITWRWDM